MSASREKKKRQAQAASSAATPVEKKSRVNLKHILYGALVVVFVIAFVLIMMVNTGFFATHSTAVTVGGHNVSPAMYNTFYGSIYSNYYNTYSYYGLISTDTALSEQYYDATTGTTWADYLDSVADSMIGDSIIWAYAMADAAEADGFVLSDELLAEIETEIETLSLYATTYGYSSADSYLNALYGTGVDTDLYREFLELQYIASEYAEVKLASFSYTTDELLAYYADNVVSFDSVAYRTYYLSGEAEDGEDSEAAMTAAEEAANAMVAAVGSSETDFIGYAYLLAMDKELESGKTYADYAESDVTASYSSASYSTVSSTLGSMAEWLFDSSRTAGDTTVLSDDAGFYVVYFSERQDNDYNTVNVRHILIEPADVEIITDEDGNEDEEATALAEEMAMQSALADAEEILNEYLAGAQTEDAFAALAETYSTDTGSNTNGGLYEDVYKGQMVSSFENWCFDATRQAGDVDIVSSSYGYHIMYYVGEGSNYRETLLDEALRSEDYSEWYEAFASSYKVEEGGFGARFMK